MSLILPFLVFGPMLGGAASYLAGRRSKGLRDGVYLGVTAIFSCLAAALFALLLAGHEPGFSLPGFGGLGISFTADGFRGIYALIITLMWLATGVFSREYFASSRNRNRYYLFNLITLGATLGVFLSADLYTTFLFFEVMSLSSYVMVAHDEGPESLRAAGTYLAVAIMGGLVMLMGLFLLRHHAGTLEIAALYSASRGVDQNILYLIGGLLLAGFGAKAGMFPLHIWLPKAHPAAPAPASALLSGALTKSGIFGVLVISCQLLRGDEGWGLAVLFLGVVTMLLGAVLAVFSLNLKRTLACSSVSQIGFILVGIGMQCLLGSHNALAVRGTLLHMVNHSLAKLTLFMAAGVAYTNHHTLNLNDLRGFGRGKPLLAFCFLSAALSVGGVPLLSGYISKTLLHESMVEYIVLLPSKASLAPLLPLLRGAEAAFILAGGLTAAYMAKLFVTIFIEKAPGQGEQAGEKGYMSGGTAAVLTLSACLPPVMGLLPQVMDFLADFGQGFMQGHGPEHEVHYFAWANLRGALISLSIGAAVYFLLIRGVMARREGKLPVHRELWPRRLDLEDSVYRPLLGALLQILGFIMGLADTLVERVTAPGNVLQGLGVSLMRFVDTLVDRIVSPGSGRPRLGVILMRLADTLVDGAVGLLRRRFLRQTRPRPFRGSFLARQHWLILTQKERGRRMAAFNESFSYGLMLFGLGTLLVLVYVFVNALRFLG